MAISSAWTTPEGPVAAAAREGEPSYPCPGWPQLAHRVSELVGGSIDRGRAVDASLWGPLKSLYPDAAIRVVQLSMPAGATPSSMVALGRALAPLRAEGILVLGAGARGSQAPAFDRWIATRVAALDISHLVEYRREAPFATAVARHEARLLPLFAVLGATRPGDRVTLLPDGVSLPSFILFGG